MNAQPRGKVYDWADRWVIPTMVFMVVIFSLYVVMLALTARNEYDPISYSLQVIERVDDAGTVSVPIIEGINGPAVRLGETVPVRGTVTNSSDHVISTEGSVLWVEQPPGLRVTSGTNLPGLFEVGTKQIRFENRIPDGVAEFVQNQGEPVQFYITGVTDVLEPGGIATTWQTAVFTLVPVGYDP